MSLQSLRSHAKAGPHAASLYDHAIRENIQFCLFFLHIHIACAPGCPPTCLVSLEMTFAATMSSWSNG
jgi:hypothetical protein